MATGGDWFDNVVDFKARQLAHMRRARQLPDVVVAGHSMTFDACEPETVQAKLPPHSRVYNAGVNLAPLGLLRDWIRYVLEVGRPQWLVIGLTTVDLNSNGIEQAELLSRHVASKMGERGGEPDYTSPELRRLWTTELARNIPRALRNARRGRPVGRAKAQYLIGPDGRDFHKTAATYRCSPGFQDRFRAKWLVDFKIGEEQFREVRSMFESAVAVRSRTALFIPPFTDDYVDLHPRGVLDVDDVVDTYYRIGQETGCPVFEAPRTRFTKGHFADPIHLNDRGMALCSDWLGDEMSRWMSDCGAPAG